MLGLSVACFLAVVSSGGVAPAQSAPEIVVTPGDAVVFGAKAVSSRHRRDMVVRNMGSAPLNVTSITIIPTVSDFRIASGGDPIAIAPGAEVAVSIVYAPTSVREHSARVEIKSNDEQAPVVAVLLSGFGTLRPEAEIDVAPEALDYGAVFIGAPSSMSVKISNTGVAQLEIRRIELGGGTSNDFYLTGFSQPILLALGASIHTEVTYTPSDEGVDVGTLLIESNDADEPVSTVPLGGSGVLEPLAQIHVMPAALNFMEVFVGTSSNLTVEIANTGSAPLELMSLELGPGTSPEFSISDSPGAVAVAPGASVTAAVGYGPLGDGADSGTLVIQSNDAAHPAVTVSLVGIGVPVPAPQIQVVPPALDFSEVFVDSSSPMVVEITNVGTASLEISAIALGPDTSADFEITGFAQPISLAPGASVTTEVTYTPSDLSVDSGTLVVDSNDGGDPRVTVSLSGRGVPAPVPQIQVTAPLVLNYGTVFIGSSSMMSVGIGNVGTAPLEITGIELGPDSSVDFEITGFSGSISLVPGASVTTEVAYTPSDTGPDSGALVINSNDTDQPVVTVSLAGSGVPEPVARINVTPRSLEFAEVFIDSPSSMTVRIANTGTATLDVSSIRLGPATSADFEITGFDQRIILVPGASVLTEITYRPSDAGADSGTLLIESDDAAMGTTIVSLSGVGVPEPMPRLDVSPLTLDYEEVQIGDERTRPVTIANSGMETLEISFIGLGADTRGEFVITSGPGSASIAPGAQITVDVTYSPSDAGADSGTLRIESNAPEKPIVSVSLTGSGVPAPVPQIEVDPATAMFGEVSVGASSRVTVTISNAGSAPLEVLDVALGAATSADFAITDGEESAVLAPGAETTVEVTYSPSDLGSDSGTLRIQSNDAEEPRVTVSLFGVGVLSGEPRFVRGDSNTDGTVDVGDPVNTIGFLFRDETPPTCFDAADANDDGSLNLSDGIFSLNWLFNGGPPSPPPGSFGCGADPTEDGLSLCVYPVELCS